MLKYIYTEKKELSYMKEYLKNFKDKKFWFSIILFLGGQSFLYSTLKHFQHNLHTFNFAIDDKIPFIPSFIFIYNMFYPFLFFTFYSIYGKDKKRYDKGVIAAFIGYIICNIIFLTYSVEMIRPDITNLDLNWITQLVLEITYSCDTPAINCFPSIHCLFCFEAIYTVLRCNNFKTRNKILTSIIALTIIASIFFVKQHYVVDMIAALIICVICNLFVELIYDKIKKKK